MNSLAFQRLALFAGLLATFGELHPLCDQWVQKGRDAAGKGAHGTHLVYVSDGIPVTEDPWRHGDQDRTCTASTYGRRCVTRHVASYTAVQTAAAVALTRLFGYRIPPAALLAGTAINAGTHAVIDRREPLLWLADRFGKRGYIDHCTAVRMDAEGTLSTEISGPGTALLELDQALHRAIGVGAAAVTTWLATRKATK